VFFKNRSFKLKKLAVILLGVIASTSIQNSVDKFFKKNKVYLGSFFIDI